MAYGHSGVCGSNDTLAPGLRSCRGVRLKGYPGSRPLLPHAANVCCGRCSSDQETISIMEPHNPHPANHEVAHPSGAVSHSVLRPHHPHATGQDGQNQV